MKISFKKTICLTAILLLAGMMLPYVSTKTMAAETDTLAKVAVPEAETFATVKSVAATGVVDGYGVRLRKKPSTSSTILELMNNEEFVHIYKNESTTNWYYVKRLKTGTCGYASKDYVLPI